MMKSLLPQKLSALFLLFVFLISACSTPAAPQAQETTAPAATEEAAKGEITVYTALEDYQIAVYLPLFEAKYPDIKVNIVRDSTGIITAK